jgi:hypothetical protein
MLPHVQRVSPGFLIAAVFALCTAAASFLSVTHALSQLPDLLRVCLAITVSLFPLYAGVRAFSSLKEVTSSIWIRGAVAMLLLMTGHGGIIVVAARQAKMDPLALLRMVTLQ